jgi:hypothetical protein
MSGNSKRFICWRPGFGAAPEADVSDVAPALAAPLDALNPRAKDLDRLRALLQS